MIDNLEFILFSSSVLFRINIKCVTYMFWFRTEFQIEQQYTSKPFQKAKNEFLFDIESKKPVQRIPLFMFPSKSNTQIIIIFRNKLTTASQILKTRTWISIET